MSITQIWPLLATSRTAPSEVPYKLPWTSACSRNSPAWFAPKQGDARSIDFGLLGLIDFKPFLVVDLSDVWDQLHPAIIYPNSIQ
jgi:hypothetical protein